MMYHTKKAFVGVIRHCRASSLEFRASVGSYVRFTEVEWWALTKYSRQHEGMPDTSEMLQTACKRAKHV